MSHLIIVLDEADKMFEDADDRHYSYIVQNELLKVLEGDMVHFDGNPSNSEPALDIDTSYRYIKCKFCVPGFLRFHGQSEGGGCE